MTSYFKLQPLAQQIQTSMMNQAADIIFSKLGYCPAFLVSQEPIDADTKLKVVKVLQWIIIRRTSLVLDIFQNQTIHQ